jgi:hypothetical protein
LLGLMTGARVNEIAQLLLMMFWQTTVFII